MNTLKKHAIPAAGGTGLTGSHGAEALISLKESIAKTFEWYEGHKAIFT
jgi:hypothetical protein